MFFFRVYYSLLYLYCTSILLHLISARTTDTPPIYLHSLLQKGRGKIQGEREVTAMRNPYLPAQAQPLSLLGFS
jgi:hypothetical protein